MQLNIMQTVRQIQSATLAARARLADQTIGTRADKGRIQIVRVAYDERGESTVTPASDWLPASEAAAFLNGLQ